MISKKFCGYVTAIKSKFYLEFHHQILDLMPVFLSKTGDLRKKISNKNEIRFYSADIQPQKDTRSFCNQYLYNRKNIDF